MGLIKDSVGRNSDSLSLSCLQRQWDVIVSRGRHGTSVLAAVSRERVGLICEMVPGTAMVTVGVVPLRPV